MIGSNLDLKFILKTKDFLRVYDEENSVGIFKAKVDAFAPFNKHIEAGFIPPYTTPEGQLFVTLARQTWTIP